MNHRVLGLCQCRMKPRESMEVKMTRQDVIKAGAGSGGGALPAQRAALLSAWA